MIKNHVAGAARTGFHIKGDACDEPSLSANNVAHSVLIGVMLLPPDGITPCTLISGFTVYKAFDFGIYHQTFAGLIIKDYISIENGVGIFPMIIGPPSLSHQYADKPIQVSAHFPSPISEYFI